MCWELLSHRRRCPIFLIFKSIYNTWYNWPLYPPIILRKDKVDPAAVLPHCILCKQRVPVLISHIKESGHCYLCIILQCWGQWAKAGLQDPLDLWHPEPSLGLAYDIPPTSVTKVQFTILYQLGDWCVYFGQNVNGKEENATYALGVMLKCFSWGKILR